jgi:hypothetical protein
VKGLREAYPETRILKVDGTKPAQSVYAEIKAILAAMK